MTDPIQQIEDFISKVSIAAADVGLLESRTLMDCLQNQRNLVKLVRAYEENQIIELGAFGQKLIDETRKEIFPPSDNEKG